MIFRTAFPSKRHCSPVLSFALAVAMGLACGLPAARGAGPGEPDAGEILRAARVNPLGNPIALEARLRSGKEQTPFRIVVDGTIRYEFDDPEQTLILELDEEGSTLTEESGGEEATVRPARFDSPVRGSDISYEDLALKFLYWARPKLLGTEILRTRPAWKIEIQAPRGGQSQYGVARLWIDRESGALLRMEGYDMRGKPTRKFEVLSARKIDGQWMLKSMRIESIDPGTRKVLSRTYLEVLGKAGAKD